MYIEASSPRMVGQKARISKRYTGLMTGGSCLSFWYHMYGSQIGSLNVYVKNSTASALDIAKWNVSGQQGNVWKNASITIYGNSLTVSIDPATLGPVSLEFSQFHFQLSMHGHAISESTGFGVISKTKNNEEKLKHTQSITKIVLILILFSSLLCKIAYSNHGWQETK